MLMSHCGFNRAQLPSILVGMTTECFIFLSMIWLRERVLLLASSLVYELFVMHEFTIPVVYYDVEIFAFI